MTQSELNLLDVIKVELAMQQKSLSLEPKNSEKNVVLADEISKKIVYFCDSLNGRISQQVNWEKRRSVFDIYSKFKRLFRTISNAINITTGEEDFKTQAERWVVPVQRFFDLYIQLLEETKRHLGSIDKSLEMTAVTQDDLQDFKLILEDDMVQEVFRSNHLILELIKKRGNSSSTLNKILSDYIG